MPSPLEVEESGLTDHSARILVFDVNETLLDLTPLEELFGNLFQDQRVMRTWFAELVLYSQSMTLAGRYANFGAIGVAVSEWSPVFAALHCPMMRGSD